MIQRLLKPSQSSSFFLFGARGTGKTTFLKSLFQDTASLFIDLLDPNEEDVFSRQPSELSQRIRQVPSDAWIVVDEIQRVPKLLDLVQKHIEADGKRFVLTVSSARKLKRGASNLLAGRAFVYNLYPFTHRELGPSFDLTHALTWGGLPKTHRLSAPTDTAAFLRAYALTYLKEEIVAEQLVRRLDPFRRFLEIAAQSNGRIVNFSRIAADAGVDDKTVETYFSILEDTHMGLLLPAFHRSVRKQQRQAPKFYFFDTGVKRALDRTLTVELADGTYAFGEAFEHLVILEIVRLSSYAANDWTFSYLRTNHGAEIDLVIDRPGKPPALVEIKSTVHVSERDVAVVAGFVGDLSPCEPFCLSRDPAPKTISGVNCLPWQEGIARLGL